MLKQKSLPQDFLCELPRKYGIIAGMEPLPKELAIRLQQGELIPAIAQNATDKSVLMLAWMNLEALQSSIKSGFATYWSRSRNELWKKGETSGNVQIIKAIKYDCDADTILLLVDQKGPACHTGSDTCFEGEIRLEK